MSLEKAVRRIITAANSGTGVSLTRAQVLALANVMRKTLPDPPTHTLPSHARDRATLRADWTKST